MKKILNLPYNLQTSSVLLSSVGQISEKSVHRGRGVAADALLTRDLTNLGVSVLEN